MNSEKTLDEIEQRKDSNNTKMADVSVEDLELNEYGLETMEKDSDYEMDVDDEEEARKEEEEEQDEEEENQEASGTSTRASRSRSVPGRGRKSSSDETTDRSSSVRSTRLSVNPDFAAKHRRFLNRVSNSLIDEATRTRTGRSRERSGKMSDKSTTRSQDRSDKSPARSQDKSDKPAVKSESDKSVAKSQEVSDKISDEPAEKLQDESDSDKPETKSQNGSGKISDKSAVKSQNKSDKMADKTEKEDETEKENDKYECENNGEASSRRASRSRSSASETRNTAKRGREDDEEEEKEKKKENGGENAEEEQQEAEEESPKRKRRTIDKNSDGAPKPIREGVDMYCWKCHREGSTVSCKICPRVFHLRCLHLEAAPPLDWVCPECSTILYAENTETRSPAMKSLTLDQLCNLLKFTLARMKSYPGSEWFCKPVDTNEFPAYSKYVVRPMDLSHLEKNIKQKRYGSTQAFYADTQWLLHNSVIFNTYQSKLTNIAKVLVKIGKQELDEIETCPECYLNAHTRKDSWFIEACKRPHLLVWAKLKGFPFWPAKAMKTNSENLVDVRFFGAHDRAWIPVKNVYLYSKLNPGASKNKRKNQFDDCISEVQQHIKKLRDKFGEFVYPSFKCSFDASKEDEQLEAMLPGYKTASRRYGKLLGPVRNFNSPSTIILKEVKKEPQDSPKNKTSLEKNKINRDEDNSRSFNGSKSSNIDEDIEEEEEENDDSSVENGEEGDDKKEKNESITASSASSSPNTKGKPTPTKGDLQVKTPTKSMDGEKSFYNKEEGNKSVEEVKGEDKRKKNEEVIEEPSAKIQQLNDSSKEVKQTPEKSLAKTDFAASLQEKLQRMMKKDTAMNSLESKTYEIEDEDEKDESKCGSDKEGENVENGSDGGMDDNDGGIDDNDDGIEDVDDRIDDVDDVIDGVDDDTTKDKEKSIENQKEKEKEKQQEKDEETSSTEKTSNEELEASSSINLVSEDDEPKEKHEKGRLRVCDLKSLGVNETVSIKVEHVDDDHDYHVSSKPAKVLDTISATIEEVVQNSSLMASKKVSDGSGKLTGIVDTLSQFSKGFERLSRNSAITIAKSETVIDCDEEDDLDIDNPRLISLLKARDPSCCSPEEMERVFSPSRRKGFPSKVRRNGSSASSTCSSEVSSVEELKRICAEQESRNEVERKRPSTTPIDELAEDSYSVLDEVSGQFMKKRMEKGNVTITLVSDDESSTSKKSNPDKSQPKGSVSLSRDVSLSIVRDDSARKDLSLDMECVESDADEVEGGKVNKSGWSSETPIQMKPTARKSFPNAAKIVTKTRDSGSEMRRMSAADIQLMNQQNGGVSTSSAKVSPVPSPKNQTNTSASFYTKISKIAASSPASEEVQISNTMSLKMINPVDSSTSSTSKTASKSSPSPILPLSVVHVVPSSSSSSLSATVAPIPSTSSAASSRPLLSTTAVTQAARVLPQLQLKPPSAPSAASTSATSRSLLRGHFGPATGRMDAMSQRLSESMMQLMEDMLNEMAHEGRFEARLKQMQLELERTQWKHRQEMAEYKHNTDLMIMEMRAGFEAERHRAIMDVRMKCQAEKEAAINETKMKQWCALCKKEALFYCCWNTAYCNYPCQQEHWPQHMANCAQTSRTQEPATNGPNKAAGAKMMAPFTATQKSISIPPTQNTASSVNSVMPPAGQTYPGPRSKTHSHMNQAQFIRQNLQVAATTALMSSTAQESNSNKVKQHSSSPLYHSSANPLHHTLPPTVTMTQPNVSSSGLRMMRAPLMCRPPIGFTIRPPQYLVSPRAPVPIPPPGYYQ